MDDNEAKKYTFNELREKYPRMGMKWKTDEDEKLKQKYQDFRSQSDNDFDVFILELVKDFGRAKGGLKARLAMHFEDVPGWDYERDKFREEARNTKVEKEFTSELDEKLREEYGLYKDGRHETYVKFLWRLAHADGWPEGKLIAHRLRQLFNNEVVKYGRSDVQKKPKFEKPRREEKPDIDFNFSNNPEALEALTILNNSKENLFLTGEAGTGKSSLLMSFLAKTQKNVVVLASTGIAAINVSGQTIHSFCSFGPDITLGKVKKLAPWSPKAKLIKSLDTIIIDEISMVRADLLDCVDKFLRINSLNTEIPFGGIQMVFIGDLFQLPPVVKSSEGGEEMFGNYNSPYFFSSKSFNQSRFLYIELRRIYRQLDTVFLNVLNAVRNNVLEERHIAILNQRVQDKSQKFTFEQFAVYLTPTNARARQVNNFFLERISSSLKVYTGKALGTFEDRELPTDIELQIKVGAQVMMLTNDFRKRWVNGTMGKVVRIISKEEDCGENSTGQVTSSDVVGIELETGEIVYVKPHTWEMIKFALEKESGNIESNVSGTFTQYPFKLAWAVTIHKAQGKTFNKVYVDLTTGTFAHGQLYVALSRCRTLEGLHLRRPITRDDVILDPRISEFMDKLLEKQKP